jgi:hypothetical protein
MPHETDYEVGYKKPPKKSRSAKTRRTKMKRRCRISTVPLRELRSCAPGQFAPVRRAWVAFSQGNRIAAAVERINARLKARRWEPCSARRRDNREPRSTAEPSHLPRRHGFLRYEVVSEGGCADPLHPNIGAVAFSV